MKTKLQPAAMLLSNKLFLRKEKVKLDTQYKKCFEKVFNESVKDCVLGDLYRLKWTFK